MDRDDRALPGLSQKLLYMFLRVYIATFSRAPRKVKAAFGRAVGRLWFAFDRRHRDIALENLAASFPEKPAVWVRQTARKSFIHFATMVFEVPGLFVLNQRNVHRYARVEGLENLRELFMQNKGFLFVTAHFGNWELLALAAGYMLGRPMTVMARVLDTAAVHRIVFEMRTRGGNRLLDKEDAASTVSAMLRQGEGLGILADQNAAGYEGVLVPFFGRAACANKGVALFSLRHRVPIVCCYALREPDGIYRVVFLPPVTMERSGNLKDDVEKGTYLVNRMMEDFIRKAPEQWLWVHRRWRMLDVTEEQFRRYEESFGKGLAH
ncbi:MAG: lysophospholipid acyltransferase family protein [Thermodesulfobacteriota bacterium]